MPSIEEELAEIDIKKILFSLIMHTPIVITTYTLPRNMEMFMQDTLAKFLRSCNQEKMIEYLSFCLGELLTNSKKANTKRIYFKEKGLDINNENDYALGMKTFRDDTFSNIDHYLELQRKEGLYIKLVLQVSNDFLKVEIRNNSKLTVFEKNRIQEKLENVHKYNSVEEVLTEVLDQTEGSGLGIIIMVLMLQKVGLSENNYQVISTDKETITRIVLPLVTSFKESIEKIQSAFADLHKPFPVIKQNLEDLEKDLNCQNPDKNEILNKISKDPVFALVLLKAANEKKSCFNLEEAFSLVGIDSLKQIFSLSNSEFQLLDSSVQTLIFWEKSVKSAFLAYNIAANFYSDKNIDLEEIYLLGLLQEFSAILSLGITEDDKSKLMEFLTKNNIDPKIFEQFIQGQCHERREKEMVNSWHFPEKVGECLLYQHDYEYVPVEIKDITEILSLATMLSAYSVKMLDFCQLDEDLLAKNHINSPDKIEIFLQQVEVEFNKFFHRKMNLDMNNISSIFTDLDSKSVFESGLE